jgi:Acyl-CoA synthetases (AMP-forming)/AMP-acid ligases II
MKLFDKFKKKSLWDSYYTETEKNSKVPDCSIYEMFEVAVKKYGKYTAIEYFGKTISYNHLLELVDKCARSFQYEGIKEDDVVTICMPNTPEAIIAFFALNKIGAIANMIHPLSGEQEIKHYLTSNNSQMLVMIDICYTKVKEVVSRTNVKKVIVVSAKDSMPFLLGLGYSLTKGLKVKKPKGSRYIYWNDFLLKSYRVQKNAGAMRKGSDPAVILHSGGTTGAPKGILHCNTAFNTMSVQEKLIVHTLKPGDSILTVMPNFHGFGLGICIVAPLTFGITIKLVPQIDVKTFDKLVTKLKPSVVVGVPTLLEAYVSSPRMKNEDISYLRHLVVGGDTLTKSLYERSRKFLDEHDSAADIIQGYGMTECLAAVSASYGNANIPCSIGIPLFGNMLKIVVPGTQDEVEPGMDGEICASGDTVMMGYLNNKKETNEMLQVHKDKRIWLHTGDSGYMDEDGIFHFQSRIKRMIISSGYNIYPAHVEEVLERHPAILKCTVIGVPHKYKVEVAKAYIVLEEGYDDSFSTKKSIKEHCEKNLAAYAMPHDFEFRKSLPTTLIGKVNFRELERESREAQSEEE